MSHHENRRRNKRATLVCMRCHDKKIKCDLQSFTGRSQQCSGCVEVFAECRYRPSQRGTVRKRDTIAVQALATDHTEPALDLVPRPLGEPLVQTESLATWDGSYDESNTWPSAVQLQDGSADEVLPPSQPVAEHAGDIQGRQPITTPGQFSQSSQANSHRAAYLGESGFMSIFRHDLGEDETPLFLLQPPDQRTTQITPVLQESYVDTYFKYAYPWCPIIDRVTMQTCPEFSNSQLLREALGLLGSQLSPPLMRHPKPAEHFHRFRQLFYDNHESQPLVRICAVMLLYWYSVGPPNVVSIDTNWWWMGAAIRLAQEIGLHREPNAEYAPRPGETNGLRRRIWWTLFARDRLTALMQGRPCAIDPDYCDLKMPSVEDFPDPTDPKAEVFVHWVRLCEIIGRVGKAIAQEKIHDLNCMPAADLLNWPRELPTHLQLPIADDRTTRFNRDVHMLHLPYLATTILLHLQKTPEKLPRASMTAIIAASCVSRILQDILGRGTLRYLPGQAGWYMSISIIALLYARNIEALTTHADADIAILLAALKQMAHLWHSSRMFYTGLERILDSDKVRIRPPGQSGSAARQAVNDNEAHTSPTLQDITATDDISWRERFPYATAKTSPLIGALLGSTTRFPFTDLEASQFNYFIDFLDDLNPDMFQVELNV